MRPHVDNLMRFVRRVHRRLVVVRALERAGACVAVASIFACVFASVALMQGRDAMPLVLSTLVLGAVVGIMWGLARRPSRFEAVVEADRQLKLADLLATAYAQRDGGDPWQLTVLALAEARCRSLSPASVVVNRYGGRAWGGIGLAAMTGLTLALLSGVPHASRARSAETNRANAAATAARAERPHGQPMNAASPQRSARVNATDRAARTGMGAEADASETRRESGSDNRFARLGRDAVSGGERAGQTAASGDAVPRPRGRGRESSDDAMATAAGGGAAAPATAGGPAGSVGSAAASGGRSASGNRAEDRETPPWSLSSWNADRAAAGDAIPSGRVPDVYRDVVSEYFRDGERDAGEARDARPK